MKIKMKTKIKIHFYFHFRFFCFFFCFRVLFSFSLHFRGKVETLQKLSPHIGISYKFFLKPVKTLNRIFWTFEYWFTAWECQIWLTNTKPFFWESEANLGTHQKKFPWVGFSYKFVFKCVKSRNRILWAMEYWFKALECQIWSTNTKPFFWGKKANFGTLQKLSPYTGVSYKFVLKCVRNLSWLWFSFFQMLWMLNV